MLNRTGHSLVAKEQRFVSELNCLGSDHWPRRKCLPNILVPSNTSNNHNGRPETVVGPERKLLHICIG